MFVFVVQLIRVVTTGSEPAPPRPASSRIVGYPKITSPSRHRQSSEVFLDLKLKRGNEQRRASNRAALERPRITRARRDRSHL